MSTSDISIFGLAEQKMAWTEKRQAVLARNIANSSTPQFRPQDLKSFSETLARTGIQAPSRTQSGHLAGTLGDVSQLARPEKPQARAPDGNAVSLDEQLTKVADTETMQSTATAIYKKYMSMFSIVLGRS